MMDWSIYIERKDIQAMAVSARCKEAVVDNAAGNSQANVVSLVRWAAPLSNRTIVGNSHPGYRDLQCSTAMVLCQPRQCHACHVLAFRIPQGLFLPEGSRTLENRTMLFGGAAVAPHVAIAASVSAVGGVLAVLNLLE